jgi:hypothetical protein
MTATPRPKIPVICFIILGVTQLLAGLGTLGAVVILFNHFPAGTPIYLVPLLALNGLAGGILAVFCGLSAWKLGRQKPKARAVSKLTWALVAGFCMWILLINCLKTGWSLGGVFEVVIWGILEALIAGQLFKGGQAVPK